MLRRYSVVVTGGVASALKHPRVIYSFGLDDDA